MRFWKSGNRKTTALWWFLGVVSCLFIVWGTLGHSGRILSQDDSSTTTHADQKVVRLFLAASHGQARKVGELLRAVDVDTLNTRGNGVLYETLNYAQHIEVPGLYGVVTTLLQHGANPNLANRAQKTPMHAAALVDKEAIMEALILAGGNPLARNGEHSTPYEMALQRGNLGVVAAIERTVTYRPTDIEDLREMGEFSRSMRANFFSARTVAERKAALRSAVAAFGDDADFVHQKVLEAIEASGSGFLGDCPSCENESEE